jgi:hypothetical protein
MIAHGASTLPNAAISQEQSALAEEPVIQRASSGRCRRCGGVNLFNSQGNPWTARRSKEQSNPQLILPSIKEVRHRARAAHPLLRTLTFELSRPGEGAPPRIGPIAAGARVRYDQSMTQRKFIGIGAWVLLGLICFATLSPISLRPETGFVAAERFVAFAALGALFVTAYPHHFLRAMLFIVIVAFALEGLQHLTPDRHGHLVDAIEKVTGGLAGSSIAWIAQGFSRKVARRTVRQEIVRVDPELTELLIGSTIIIIFGMALLIAQNH